MLPSHEYVSPRPRIEPPSPLGGYIRHSQQPAALSSPKFSLENRLSLVSLDLASPPIKSALPLTPPLTPASSNGARSAESDSRSSRSNSIDIPCIDTCAHDYSSLSQWSSPAQFISNCTVGSQDSSILPSPTSPTRTRGRSPITYGTDFEHEFEVHSASRFLFVSGVPKAADSQTLKQAFLGCGDLKGIFVHFQAQHGVIVLAFYDMRHAVRAQSQISMLTYFENTRLDSRFISTEHLRQLIGQSNFVSSNDGDMFISTSFVRPGGKLDAAALQTVLASLGGLRSFGAMDTHATTFRVEYFDARDAISALTALNDRVILGVRLHLSLHDSETRPENPTPAPSPSPSPFTHLLPGARPSPTGSIPFPRKDSHPTREFSLSDALPPPCPALRRSASMQNLRATSPAPPPSRARGRRMSNIYHFDSVGKTPPPCTPPRPRSISVSSEAASPVAGRMVLLPDTPVEQETYWSEQEAYSPEQMFMVPAPSAPPAAAAPRLSPVQMQIPASMIPLQAQVQTQTQICLQAPPAPHRPMLGFNTDALPERNRIDIARIERGDDARTTVMIKNIPNKMSDGHLVDFINHVCPQKIDFLYLRMDFTNGCNVGYAFVNFIHVKDLHHFAKVKIGTKWNLFSSEKVLGMSYANFQGKAALIEKFQSSTVMDQREAWRPKLFHSCGPKKGFPEDFPVSTHVHRKERSHRPSKLQQARLLFHHLPRLHI